MKSGGQFFVHGLILAGIVDHFLVQEIQRTFSIEENTVVILPLTSETPHQHGFADIEKILVDVLADTPSFSIINIPELIEGAKSLTTVFRVDIAILKRYADRRKTSISELVKWE